jgi:hypothetical protein
VAGGSVFAWWNLTRQQKEALQEQREAGRFGGIPGHAPYFWVQEGSIVGAGPAQKAGKTPTYFIEKSLGEAEGAIADALVEALSAG